MIVLKRTTSPPARGGHRWECVCDCGEFHEANGSKLKSGSVKSCGCLRAKKIDLTGQRFGKLVALDFTYGTTGKRKDVFWRCSCDCGREVVTSAGNLRSGNSNSCGCSRVLPENGAAINLLHGRYRRGAAERDFSFELSKEELRELVSQPCHYCGIEGGNTLKDKRENREPFRWNGIDRIDNSKGYVVENVVPSCRDCNFAKGPMTYEDFKGYLGRVAAFLSQR